MKESGVRWVGRTPSDWSVQRGKDLLIERSSRSSTGQEELLSVSAYFGVKRRKELIDTDDPISRAESLIDYKLCHRGDLIINTMLAWNGSIGVAPCDGIVSPSYSVYSIRQKVRGDYLAYLLRDVRTLQEIRAESRGINDARLRLYPESLNAMCFALPEHEEQFRIASWLDFQTRRIDKRLKLLGSKRELLIKLRWAVIRETVTAGVLWDSDNGQVSQLPPGWQIVRIKDIAKLKSGDFVSAEKIAEIGAFPVFGGNGLRGFTNTYNCEGGFALIGRQGALCGNVNFANGRFWATEHAVVVRTKRRLVTRWLGEILRCLNLNQYATASAQPGLSVEVIVNKFLPLPTLSEQQHMVDCLDRELPRIDKQIGLIDRLETLLKEQRKAIIHEAVTGKIDLSQYEPPPTRPDTAR